MTTEVLRNMLFARSPQLAGLGLVVLDEVHYLQDPYRGSVWEEVHHPHPARGGVRVPVGDGVQRRRVRRLADERARAHRGRRGGAPARRAAQSRGHRREGEPARRPGAAAPRRHASTPRRWPSTSVWPVMARRPGGLRHSRLAGPRRSELVEALDDRSMLPAIVFIFSRAACDDAVAQCLSDGMRLTTSEAASRDPHGAVRSTPTGFPTRSCASSATGRGPPGSRRGWGRITPGSSPPFGRRWRTASPATCCGWCSPPRRSSLGINMPARTVVIERLTKIREHGRSGLSSGEYAQMTGRAGRRGLDSVGHAVVVWSPQVSMAAVAALATSAAARPPFVVPARPTTSP